MSDRHDKPDDASPAPDDRPRDAEIDVAHYRRLLRDQKQAGDSQYIEIGGEGTARRFWRSAGWACALLGVAGLFVYLFLHFTNDLRVALVVVTGVLAYMLIASWLAEGRLDERFRE